MVVDTRTHESLDSGRLAGVKQQVLLHPARSVFVLALLVRVVSAIVIWAVWGGSIFGDELTYSEMAAAVAEGRTGAWDAYTRWLYWDTAAWTLPLTGLYMIFGPVVLAGQSLAAGLGAVTAALTARLGREGLAPAWAFAAGAAVALFPSQILWSSLTLKDAAVWAAAVLGGLAVARALSAAGRGRVGWGLTLVASLIAMAFLRTHTFVVVTWAAGLAIAIAAGVPLLRRTVAAALLVVALPWVLGLGPAAIGFVVNQTDTLAERRLANAQGASTALGDLRDDSPASSDGRPGGGADGSDDRPDPGGDRRPDASQGPSAPSDDAVALSDPDLRYLPRGLVAMLFDPLPQNIQGNPRVRLAALEHLVWYPLLALAVAGTTRAWGRRRVLAYPLLTGGATTVMYGLAEGNFGTAYRHRGEIVWIVALLAAFGAHWLCDAYRTRQERQT